MTKKTGIIISIVVFVLGGIGENIRHRWFEKPQYTQVTDAVTERKNDSLQSIVNGYKESKQQDIMLIEHLRAQNIILNEKFNNFTTADADEWIDSFATARNLHRTSHSH